MLVSKLLLACGSVAAAAAVYVTNKAEAPSVKEPQAVSAEDPEIASWSSRLYNTDHVQSWTLVGQWEDVEGPATEGLKKAVGDGPHSIRVMVDIEVYAREHDLKSGSIAGLWGEDMLRIENNDTADPFSPAWTGVDNHWDLYGWGANALSPTTYNWTHVISYTPGSETCWQTAVSVPSGTSPGAVGNEPPIVEAGDKYRVCATDEAHGLDCTVKIELSIGRCWEHTVDCKDDGDTDPAGYWHHDVSAGEFIVTGSRVQVPCE